MNDEEHRAIDILGDLTLNLDFHDDEVKEAIKVVLKRLIILDKALAAARDEALEEAIKVAQGSVCTHSPIGPLHQAGWTGAANAIEERIRTLKSHAQKEGGGR